MAPHPQDWVAVDGQGLHVVPGGFAIDPVRPVARAVITHGHADHARPGHGAVLATPETCAIMRARLGDQAAGRFQPVRYHETVRIGDVDVTLVPAGHVLGSAQVVVDHGGGRLVVSGDYKRQPDPTCAPFEPVPCDVFVTEATFALPVFRHPSPEGEIAKVLDALALFPDRAVLVGCYGLGKCQRLVALLRAAGWDRPIHLHGALVKTCTVYERCGVALGPLVQTGGAARKALAGEIVLAPPSATADRWSRALPDPLVAQASGWMRIRQRAKQSGVELPLVISDHADWDDLLRTLDEVAAPEVWITHGRDEALALAAQQRGLKARALALVGREEGDDEG